MSHKSHILTRSQNKSDKETLMSRGSSYYELDINYNPRTEHLQLKLLPIDSDSANEKSSSENYLKRQSEDSVLSELPDSSLTDEKRSKLKNILLNSKQVSLETKLKNASAHGNDDDTKKYQNEGKLNNKIFFTIKPNLNNKEVPVIDPERIVEKSRKKSRGAFTTTNEIFSVRREGADVNQNRKIRASRLDKDDQKLLLSCEGSRRSSKTPLKRKRYHSEKTEKKHANKHENVRCSSAKPRSKSKPEDSLKRTSSDYQLTAKTLVANMVKADAEMYYVMMSQHNKEELKNKHDAEAEVSYEYFKKVFKRKSNTKQNLNADVAREKLKPKNTATKKGEEKQAKAKTFILGKTLEVVEDILTINKKKIKKEAKIVEKSSVKKEKDRSIKQEYKVEKYINVDRAKARSTKTDPKEKSNKVKTDQKKEDVKKVRYKTAEILIADHKQIVKKRPEKDLTVLGDCKENGVAPKSSQKQKKGTDEAIKGSKCSSMEETVKIKRAWRSKKNAEALKTAPERKKRKRYNSPVSLFDGKKLVIKRDNKALSNDNSQSSINRSKTNDCLFVEKLDKNKKNTTKQNVSPENTSVSEKKSNADVNKIKGDCKRLRSKTQKDCSSDNHARHEKKSNKKNDDVPSKDVEIDTEKKMQSKNIQHTDNSESKSSKNKVEKVDATKIKKARKISRLLLEAKHLQDKQLSESSESCNVKVLRKEENGSKSFSKKELKSGKKSEKTVKKSVKDSSQCEETMERDLSSSIQTHHLKSTSPTTNSAEKDTSHIDTQEEILKPKTPKNRFVNIAERYKEPISTEDEHLKIKLLKKAQRAKIKEANQKSGQKSKQSPKEKKSGKAKGKDVSSKANSGDCTIKSSKKNKHYQEKNLSDLIENHHKAYLKGDIKTNVLAEREPNLLGDQKPFAQMSIRREDFAESKSFKKARSEEACKALKPAKSSAGSTTTNYHKPTKKHRKTNHYCSLCSENPKSADASNNDLRQEVSLSQLHVYPVLAHYASPSRMLDINQPSVRQSARLSHDHARKDRPRRNKNPFVKSIDKKTVLSEVITKKEKTHYSDQSDLINFYAKPKNHRAKSNQFTRKLICTENVIETTLRPSNETKSKGFVVEGIEPPKRLGFAGRQTKKRLTRASKSNLHKTVFSVMEIESSGINSTSTDLNTDLSLCEVSELGTPSKSELKIEDRSNLKIVTEIFVHQIGGANDDIVQNHDNVDLVLQDNSSSKTLSLINDLDMILADIKQNLSQKSSTDKSKGKLKVLSKDFFDSQPQYSSDGDTTCWLPNNTSTSTGLVPNYNSTFSGLLLNKSSTTHEYQKNETIPKAHKGNMTDFTKCFSKTNGSREVFKMTDFTKSRSQNDQIESETVATKSSQKPKEATGKNEGNTQRCSSKLFEISIGGSFISIEKTFEKLQPCCDDKHKIKNETLSKISLRTNKISTKGSLSRFGIRSKIPKRNTRLETKLSKMLKVNPTMKKRAPTECFERVILNKNRRCFLANECVYLLSNILYPVIKTTSMPGRPKQSHSPSNPPKVDSAINLVDRDRHETKIKKKIDSMFAHQKELIRKQRESDTVVLDEKPLQKKNETNILELQDTLRKLLGVKNKPKPRSPPKQEINDSQVSCLPKKPQGSSLLLTKDYKESSRIKAYQKRKLYAEGLRRSNNNKNVSVNKTTTNSLVWNIKECPSELSKENISCRDVDTTKTSDAIVEFGTEQQSLRKNPTAPEESPKNLKKLYNNAWRCSRTQSAVTLSTNDSKQYSSDILIEERKKGFTLHSKVEGSSLNILVMDKDERYRKHARNQLSLSTPLLPCAIFLQTSPEITDEVETERKRAYKRAKRKLELLDEENPKKIARNPYTFGELDEARDVYVTEISSDDSSLILPQGDLWEHDYKEVNYRKVHVSESKHTQTSFSEDSLEKTDNVEGEEDGKTVIKMSFQQYKPKCSKYYVYNTAVNLDKNVKQTRSGPLKKLFSQFSSHQIAKEHVRMPFSDESGYESCKSKKSASFRKLLKKPSLVFDLFKNKSHEFDAKLSAQNMLAKNDFKESEEGANEQLDAYESETTISQSVSRNPSTSIFKKRSSNLILWKNLDKTKNCCRQTKSNILQRTLSTIFGNKKSVNKTSKEDMSIIVSRPVSSDTIVKIGECENLVEKWQTDAQLPTSSHGDVLESNFKLDNTNKSMRNVSVQTMKTYISVGPKGEKIDNQKFETSGDHQCKEQHNGGHGNESPKEIINKTKLDDGPKTDDQNSTAKIDQIQNTESPKNSTTHLIEVGLNHGANPIIETPTVFSNARLVQSPKDSDDERTKAAMKCFPCTNLFQMPCFTSKQKETAALKQLTDFEQYMELKGKPPVEEKGKSSLMKNMQYYQKNVDQCHEYARKVSIETKFRKCGDLNANNCYKEIPLNVLLGTTAKQPKEELTKAQLEKLNMINSLAKNENINCDALSKEERRSKFKGQNYDSGKMFAMTSDNVKQVFLCNASYVTFPIHEILVKPEIMENKLLVYANENVNQNVNENVDQKEGESASTKINEQCGCVCSSDINKTENKKFDDSTRDHEVDENIDESPVVKKQSDKDVRVETATSNQQAILPKEKHEDSPCESVKTVQTVLAQNENEGKLNECEADPKPPDDVAHGETSDKIDAINELQELRKTLTDQEVFNRLLSSFEKQDAIAEQLSNDKEFFEAQLALVKSKDSVEEFFDERNSQDKTTYRDTSKPNAVDKSSKIHIEDNSKTHSKDNSKAPSENIARAHYENIAKTHSDDIAKAHSDDIAKEHLENNFIAHPEDNSKTHLEDDFKTHPDDISKMLYESIHKQLLENNSKADFKYHFKAHSKDNSKASFEDSSKALHEENVHQNAERNNNLQSSNYDQLHNILMENFSELAQNKRKSEHSEDNAESSTRLFKARPSEISRCFKRGFRPDNIVLSGKPYPIDDTLIQNQLLNKHLATSESFINFSEKQTPLEYLLELGFSVDEASNAIKDPDVTNRLSAAIREARIWINNISSTQGTLIYLLSCKIKPKIMRYFLQLVEAVINRRIKDAVKLDSFLRLLLNIENGDVNMNKVFDIDKFEDEQNEDQLVKKQLRQVFIDVYKIANLEASKHNNTLSKESIQLLRILAAKYRAGLSPHLELIARYIGQGLLVDEVQLEAAMVYLSRLSTANVKLNEFEKYCDIRCKNS